MSKAHLKTCKGDLVVFKPSLHGAAFPGVEGCQRASEWFSLFLPTIGETRLSCKQLCLTLSGRPCLYRTLSFLFRELVRCQRAPALFIPSTLTERGPVVLQAAMLDPLSSPSSLRDMVLPRETHGSTSFPPPLSPPPSLASNTA
jgi:hypothetical protein